MAPEFDKQLGTRASVAHHLKAAYFIVWTDTPFALFETVLNRTAPTFVARSSMTYRPHLDCT
eukprot:633996-Pleurochrysis_carterae.AAC.1